ncbi:MAG: UDP-N-acetylmuramoyl-tripeptide--D-alanyl-D-alanine ligase [Candidatus Omnitrophica bacterium]|nr:UDP-N-acetylmuramoyl-tripeptide--D-alanyl-D-alanine ligase [Candidatus Omnitrophota bacterium]
MNFDIFKLKEIIRPKKIYNLYHQKPIKGFSIDSRTINNNEVFIAIKGKYKDGHSFISDAIDKGASLIISEVDILIKQKVPIFVVDNTYKVLEKLIVKIRERKNPFVFAITGSVGKTTTKEMLSFLLEKDFEVLKNQKSENNLLGVAKTFFSLKEQKIVVLELGTNFKGEIKLLAELVKPDVGIITFIKPVHLEGLRSLKDIFLEKISLFRVNPKIEAILNRDDRYLRKVDFCKKIFWFGKRKDSDLYARPIKLNFNSSTFKVQDKFVLTINNPFSDFIYNALAAIVAASRLDIPLPILIERMNNFNLFPTYRMQIDKIKNFLIFNDAYNANPYSFKKAFSMLSRYKQEKIAVIADMLELGNKSIYYHRLLAADVIKCNFKYCIMFGKYTFYLFEQLKKMGYKNALYFSTHKEIASFLKEKAKKDWLIFLKGSRNMELEKVIEFLYN